MGRVLGQHGMLHRRSEVDVEYGEEEQAVNDQGDEDAVPRKMRLSRADHMITVHVHILHVQRALWLYNMRIAFTNCITLVKLERVGIHCIVLFSRCFGEEGLLLQSEGGKWKNSD